MRDSEYVNNTSGPVEGSFSFLEPGCITYTDPDGKTFGVVVAHGERYVDGNVVSRLGFSQPVTELFYRGIVVDLEGLEGIADPSQNPSDLCPGMTEFVVAISPVPDDVAETLYGD
ncbi:MAG: hypothetical protein R2770_00865 [Acidimicrobiales bacterium]